MTSREEIRYMQAFARIIGVKESDTIEYAQRKGIAALIDNASQLLTTQAQREKHQAFLDLYRMSTALGHKNPVIHTPEAAAAFFRSVMDNIHDKEAMVVASLNAKNRVIDYDIVSLGTISSSIAHPREIFRNAILNKASAVILCHNHPSGDVTPSQEDQQTTGRLKDIGELLSIPVLDHVIITGVNQNEVYSFRANGVFEETVPYQAGLSVSENAESYQVNKDGLKEITQKLETGIRDFFDSEKYQAYLRTMSRFHRYSLNNTLLIALQNPDASLVAGYNKWQGQFDRSVKKGEKSIKIIAPAPYKVKREQQKLDPKTHAPLLDKAGKAITEEVEVKVPMYRVVSVFDVSQTEGKPLPPLASILTGDVRQYDNFLEALKRASPVPIGFESMKPETDGYFSLTKQQIALRSGMSEVQTVSAAIHEIAHAKLHNRSLARQASVHEAEPAKPARPKDRRTEEVEAESISYAVCTYYGIQTGENSFGYIAAWSKDKDLPELRASLETISQTASELIDDIDHHFAVLSKENQIDTVQPKQQTSDHQVQALRDQPDNSFAIYQVKDGDEYRDYRFESLKHLQTSGLDVHPDHYDLVYTGPLTKKADLDRTLNGLYRQFNQDLPADFTGHSLSVSDVVVLKQDDRQTAHYVDSWSFQPLPSFLPQASALRSVEDTVEQNDNHFDGVINNLPDAAGQNLASVANYPVLINELPREQSQESSDRRVSLKDQLKPPAIKQTDRKAALAKGIEMEL
ncbi:MAG: JAB domain-containing protein [Eubacteriales bacterium]|nr:JAB domain-containing protein [Eubacteriales bacterium]